MIKNTQGPLPVELWGHKTTTVEGLERCILNVKFIILNTKTVIFNAKRITLCKIQVHPTLHRRYAGSW